MAWSQVSSLNKAAERRGPLVTRLSQHVSLNAHECRILQQVETRPRTAFSTGSVLAQAGGSIERPLYIASGWVGVVRAFADGRRQLLGALLPGDFAGLQVRHPSLTLADLTALTPAFVTDATDLVGAWRNRREYSNLVTALDLCAAEEEAIRLDQIARLGRQSALERMAHLFLEWEYRLATRGLANGGAFDMPLTQEMLGDILGLSIVHINRTIQQLRRLELVELEKGRLSLLNRRTLATIAEFHGCALSAGNIGIATCQTRGML
jgi:CRP-like cAMP-binding protein